jgi:hypothetical protein
MVNRITSSGLKAASASIVPEGALLWGVQADTGTTAIIYDNPSAASGNILAIGTKGDTIFFNQPIAANNGIYVSVSGGTGAVVYYSLGE